MSHDLGKISKHKHIDLLKKIFGKISMLSVESIPHNRVLRCVLQKYAGSLQYLPIKRNSQNIIQLFH